VRIRPVAAQDRAVWGGLWRAYLAFYETELPSSVYDTTFTRLLKSSGDGPFGLLAEIDGHAVGLCHYLFHGHCWRPEGVCYLQDLYTAPQARGHGAGRALIEAVYAAADAAGKPSVYWLTQEDNATARALYDRIALKTPFIKYGRRT
jgi:GNAT superfamily N-acetyltransferase